MEFYCRSSLALGRRITCSTRCLAVGRSGARLFGAGERVPGSGPCELGHL